MPSGGLRYANDPIGAGTLGSWICENLLNAELTNGVDILLSPV